MDNKDNDVKNALDELFGSDFIEISVDSYDDNTNDFDISKDEKIEINKYTNEENSNENKSSSGENIEKNVNIDDNKNFFTPNYVTTISKNKKSNKTIFILVSSILIFILLVGVLYFIIFSKKTIKCTLSAVDTGYKFYNKYYITHKMDDIKFIKSMYKYTATTDEYKHEVENVKGEKIPIVINSNGMPGFTYTYETTDVYYKMNGYIDFEKIDFQKIDKLDQNLLKLSEYKINSKLTYKKLIKTLEKDGYICTNKK